MLFEQKSLLLATECEDEKFHDEHQCGTRNATAACQRIANPEAAEAILLEQADQSTPVEQRPDRRLSSGAEKLAQLPRQRQTKWTISEVGNRELQRFLMTLKTDVWECEVR